MTPSLYLAYLLFNKHRMIFE